MRLTILLVIALVLTFPGAALADAQVGKVFIKVVHGSQTEVNVRTEVRNPSSVRQKGPVMVDLYVRGDSSEAWRHLYTYPAIGGIPARERVVRDYFVPAHRLDPALASGHFQVKATSSLPDGSETENIATYDE